MPSYNDSRYPPPPPRKAGQRSVSTAADWILSRRGEKVKKWLERHPDAHASLSAKIVNKVIDLVPVRPEPLSCGWEYTTWEGLTNRRWTSRHLPPVMDVGTGNSAKKVAEKLFARDLVSGKEIFHESEKSTLLFAYFAQWLTDGFLVADRVDRRRNFSNHQIDLAQFYGLHPETTNLIRKLDDEGGLLKSRRVGDADYLPLLYNKSVDLETLWDIDPQFRKTRRSYRDFSEIAFQQLQVEGEPINAHGPYGPDWKLKEQTARGSEHATTLPPWLQYSELIPGHSEIFGASNSSEWNATANDRGNSALAFTMFNTLMMREHNRIAAEIQAKEPGNWNGERIFQTTRLILTAMMLKLVVQEYIGHISERQIPLLFDPKKFHIAAKWRWTNWMAVEFNLLYRWHSMIPDQMMIGGAPVPLRDTLWNPGLVERHGLGPLFHDASIQAAGRIGVKNTERSQMLNMTDLPMIQMGRTVNLAPYNDYRAYFNHGNRAKNFEDINTDPEICKVLKELYGHVDNVEFVAGIFAEPVQENGALGNLMSRMVGVDAFSQALTNPLLSERIWHRETFGKVGWDLLHQPTSLHDLVKRNTPEHRGDLRVSFTRKDWKPT